MRNGPAISLLALTMAAGALFLTQSGHAQQFDTPYYELEKKHAAEWAKQDEAIDAKLAALEKKFGKKPNIIYVLTDDVGWGTLGCYGGGKICGMPTPALDEMARQGMKLLSAYAEPSCTPTRLALLTGRQPPRTGVNVVLWPGQKEGLVANEYTIAELLSDAGYDTAMWGKWHVGDAREEHHPHNQGFDFAQWSPYNGAVWSWEDDAAYYRRNNILPGNSPHFMDVPEDYFERFGYEPHWIHQAVKGEEAQKIRKADTAAYQDIDTRRTDEIISYIGEHADSDRPFFVYFASDAHNAVAANNPEHRFAEHVDSANNMAVSLVEHDHNMRRILDTLREQGIAENTLVLWISDNGPMYGHFPNAGYSHFRGGKSEVTEGGVRVPAIAWWPGVIEPDQEPIDLFHVTDMFTTAARLAGAMDSIPTDRVTDGIDQTALLLLGENHSRRNFIFHYSGPEIGAIRLDHMKMHYHGMKGGLPQFEIYNMKRDPGERHAKAVYRSLQWTVPFMSLMADHNELKTRFPDRRLDPKTGAEIR